MAQSPKGRLIHGLYKPIHGNCCHLLLPWCSYCWYLPPLGIYRSINLTCKCTILLKEKKGNQVSSGIGMTKPVESGVTRFESQHHRAPNHQALPLVECWYDLLTWWILIRNFQKLRMERTRMETKMNPWKRKFHRCFFGSHHFYIWN